MTIIWWTLYILGALTAIITWLNLMMLLGRLFKIIRDKEWMQVKVVEGLLNRKDIESLIRMEIAAHLSKLEVSRTTYPGLGEDEVKFGLKEDK